MMLEYNIMGKNTTDKNTYVVKKEKEQTFALLTGNKLSEYERKKRAWKHRRRVLYITFAVILVLFFAFGYIAPLIWPNTMIAQLAEENIVGLMNFVHFFENNLDVIFRALSVVFVGVLVMIILLGIFSWISAKGSNRSKTVTSLIASCIKYIGTIVIFGVLLGTLGVDTTTLLASVGVIGIIIGFGAQSLVSDILAGLFIVFENSFQVGDIITVGVVGEEGFRGTVTDIGLRTTKIKNPVGDLKIINNSEIRTLINMTRHSSMAVCEVTVSYSENLEKVEKVIKDALPAIGQKLKAITESPKYLGVAQFTERGVLIKVIARCEEVNRLQLVRDLNREIKLLFDENKIKIAVPQIEIKKQ
jgi:small conductance mechanosensitive channel